MGDRGSAWISRASLARPADDGEDVELVRRIRAEIEERGPITVARFMERALYEPEHGYYRRLTEGPGRGGDFLTAPEAHPIFGASFARLAEATWGKLGRPDPFVIAEPGSGSGALAHGLLDELRRSGSPLLDAVRYRPADIESARQDATHRRLEQAGFRRHLATTPPRTAEAGMIVANEVVDALPVHRVVRRGTDVLERVVTWDGRRFVEQDGPPAGSALMARLAGEAIQLEEGQVAEICLLLDDWLRDVTQSLERGLLVLVDYGEDAGDLYRGRPDGTLRAFRGHAVGSDPYVHVGRQDLTAHVDLTALRAAAATTGLELLAETTQAELLVSIGAGELVAERLRAPDADLAGALELRSALVRLLDPRGMGGFRVLAFGRHMDGWVPTGFGRVARPAGR